MTRGAGEPSTKRAKVDEADEEEDPLMRRKEELVRLLEEARAKSKGRGRGRGLGRGIKKELLTLCARLEAKNDKLLRRLPPELWQKIIDENLDQNDLPALAMTCRFFRKKQKDLRWELVVTNLNPKCLLELRRSGKMVPYSLGWFRWVCDTFKFRRDCDRWGFERNMVNCAALQGSVKLLRWLMEEKGWDCDWDYYYETGLYAAFVGSVEVLEYLRRKGYSYDEGACAEAARGGQLEALKFLRGLKPPCDWSAFICTVAAAGGRMGIVKWIRGEGSLYDMIPPGYLDWESYGWAAEGGHLEVLKWVRSQDPPCPWNGWACQLAAGNGQLEALKFLRDQDPPCPWSRHECRYDASHFGHQHVIDWIDQREDESDGDDYF